MNSTPQPCQSSADLDCFDVAAGSLEHRQAFTDLWTKGFIQQGQTGGVIMLEAALVVDPYFKGLTEKTLSSSTGVGSSHMTHEHSLQPGTELKATVLILTWSDVMFNPFWLSFAHTDFSAHWMLDKGVMQTRFTGLTQNACWPCLMFKVNCEEV